MSSTSCRTPGSRRRAGRCCASYQPIVAHPDRPSAKSPSRRRSGEARQAPGRGGPRRMARRDGLPGRGPRRHASSVPPRREARALAVAEALDCSSHRLDAWATAVVSAQPDPADRQPASPRSSRLHDRRLRSGRGPGPPERVRRERVDPRPELAARHRRRDAAQLAPQPPPRRSRTVGRSRSTSPAAASRRPST